MGAIPVLTATGGGGLFFQVIVHHLGNPRQETKAMEQAINSVEALNHYSDNYAVLMHTEGFEHM